MYKSLSLLCTVSCLFFVSPSGQAQAPPTLDAEQSSFLTLINNYRAQNGAESGAEDGSGGPAAAMADRRADEAAGDTADHSTTLFLWPAVG